MIPRLVHKIEGGTGGYPERDGGAEEGQGWGDSMRLISQNIAGRFGEKAQSVT